MSFPQQDERFRDVLTGLIGARYGSLTRTTLREFAGAAGLQYTTLARYFGFYGPAKQTKRLQQGTARAVLQALGVETAPSLGVTPDKQLDLWPTLVRPDPRPSPFSAVEEVLVHLRQYAEPVQVIACRAAKSRPFSPLSRRTAMQRHWRHTTASGRWMGCSPARATSRWCEDAAASH